MQRALLVATGIAVAMIAVAWWVMARPPAKSTRADDAAPVVPTSSTAPPGRIAPRTAKAESPAAAATDVPSSTTPGVVVTGRVVDSTMHVVVGAHVDASTPNAGVHRNDTDATGRFRIDVGERRKTGPMAGRIHCFSDAGGVGVGQYAVGPAGESPIDVGTIRLGAGGRLDVHVAHAGAAVGGASVRLFVAPGWSSYGAWLRLLETSTDSEGRARFDHVPAGPVSVTASSSQFGRGSAEAVVPSSAATACEVELTRREVSVVVSVRGSPDLLVEGAVLDVLSQRIVAAIHRREAFDPPLDVAPTDAAGRTRIVVGEKDDLVVGAHAPGFAAQSELHVRPGVTQLTIEMVRDVGLSWPVVAGEVPPPPDGTAIRLRPRIGSGRSELPAGGRMVGSDLVVDGIEPGLFSAIAVAPDGSIASLWADTKEGHGRPTSFLHPRKIDVNLTEEGTPLAGAYVLAINPGNNPYGPPVATDAAGRAVLADFEGGLVAVHLVGSADSRFPEHLLGTVKLDLGDATVEADLPRARTIVASVTVDDVPALPPMFYVAPAAGVVVGTERDADAGVLTLRVRPEKPFAPIALNATSQGYLPVHVDVPGAAWNEPARVDIALRRGGSLVGRVLPPSDGRTSLSVERENSSGVAWMPVAAVGNVISDLSLDAAGGVRIDGLASGRYRLRDKRSGATTAAVDVVAGAEATPPTLDLSASGDAKGRVEGPDGSTPAGCRVLVEGDGIDQSDVFPRAGPPGVAVAGDGTFSVRVPGDRTVRIRPWHATLTSAPDGGVELVQPRDGIVLRLVPGPTASLELSAAPDPMHFGDPVRALLFQGEPGPTPVSTLSASLAGQTVTLGGYAPGTYTIWIDAAGYAPAVLRDVELRSGRTELPRVELSRGSTVRVKLLVRQGQSPPRAYVFASPVAGPPYSRGLNSFGSAEVLVKGLGAGKFTLMGGLNQGQHDAFTREVEVDGTNTVDIEWDMR